MIDLKWQMINLIEFFKNQSPIAIILEFILVISLVMYVFENWRNKSNKE